MSEMNVPKPVNCPLCEIGTVGFHRVGCLNDFYERFNDGRKQVDALKAEVETFRIDAFTWQGRAEEYQKDRDHWKSLAEKAIQAARNSHVYHRCPGSNMCELCVFFKSFDDKETKGD